MSRLFLGFELPEQVKRQLLETHEPLPGARWQRADQLHLTLRFLGELGESDTLAIVEALADLTAASPEIRIRGAGCFGGPHRPFALWAGVSPEEPLIKLRQEIDTRLAPLALVPERHSGFKPHITLARISGGDVSAIHLAERRVGLTTAPFVLNAVSLFSSRQEARGSVYSVLRRFPLL